jgi:hypothetical protein
VVGMKDEVELLSGEADARFISTKIQYANVALDWLGGVCIDRDKDSHGKGPGCAGSDCDDSDPLVNQSAREDCNGFDDDCDGETDNVPDADKPRCQHYKGVCRLAPPKTASFAINSTTTATAPSTRAAPASWGRWSTSATPRIRASATRACSIASRWGPPPGHGAMPA